MTSIVTKSQLDDIIELPSLTKYTSKQPDHDVCDTREHRRHGFTPKLLGRGISPTPRHDVLRPESPPPTPPDLQSRKVSSRPSSRRRSVARVLWLVGFVLLAGYFALPGIKRSDGPSPSHIAKTRTVANTLTSNSPNANANVNTSISSAELARLTGGPARVVQKNIEDIVEGDRVIAWDDVTGQQVVRPVVRTFENVSDHLRVVRVRGSDGTTQEIKTTNEHPFWVPDKGWVSAKDLETGTRLVQSDGQCALVELTSLDVRPKGTCVYNFEVLGAHNYYVAAQGVRGPPVLVHNECVTEGVSELVEKGGKKKVGKKASKQCLTSTAVKEAPMSGKWNRPNVQDTTLKDVMDNLWRPQDKRPGGTIAELLREKAAGGPLIHLEKAKGRLTQLIKRVSDYSNPLSKADRAAAERVINDLKDAIKIAEGR